MKSEKELIEEAVNAKDAELQAETKELVRREIAKYEALFVLIICLTIALSMTLAQIITQGFNVLGVTILALGVFIEARLVFAFMDYESAMVKAAELIILMHKRAKEFGLQEHLEQINKALDEEEAKKAAPKTRKPRTKKSEAKADEKPKQEDKH